MRRGRSWSCSPVWWHHNVWLARYPRPPVLVRMDKRGNSPLLRGAGSRPARMDNLVWALGSWFGEPRHLGEGRRRASGYQGAHARSARSPHPSYRDTSSTSSSVAPLAPVTPSAWHSSPPNSGSRSRPHSYCARTRPISRYSSGQKSSGHSRGSRSSTVSRETWLVGSPWLALRGAGSYNRCLTVASLRDAFRPFCFPKRNRAEPETVRHPSGSHHAVSD